MDQPIYGDTPVTQEDYRIISPKGKIVARANHDLRYSKEWRMSDPDSTLEQAWSTNRCSGWNVILVRKAAVA